MVLSSSEACGFMHRVPARVSPDGNVASSRLTPMQLTAKGRSRERQVLQGYALPRGLCRLAAGRSAGRRVTMRVAVALFLVGVGCTALGPGEPLQQCSAVPLEIATQAVREAGVTIDLPVGAAPSDDVTFIHGGQQWKQGGLSVEISWGDWALPLPGRSPYCVWSAGGRQATVFHRRVGLGHELSVVPWESEIHSPLVVVRSSSPWSLARLESIIATTRGEWPAAPHRSGPDAP